YGWFEPRLDASDVVVPHRVAEAGRRAEVGRFAIPVRFGGERSELRGAFRFVPRPAGTAHARLVSPAEIAPGVRVRVLPGETPGLLVANESAEPLVVVGESGEPFLRIGPDGAFANVASE